MTDEEQARSVLVQLRTLKAQFETIETEATTAMTAAETAFSTLEAELVDAKGLADEVFEAARACQSGLSDTLTDLTGHFEAAIKPAMADAGDRVSEATAALGKAAAESWCEALSELRVAFNDFAENGSDRIAEGVDEQLAELQDTLQGAGSDLKEALESAANETATALKDVRSSVEASIKSVEGTIVDFEGTLGRLDDLVSAVSATTKTATDVASGAMELFRELV